MTDTTTWRELGRVAPDELEDTRRQLHWAAQLPAAVGETRLTHAPDFGHLALEVRATDGLLLGGVSRDGSRAGLRLGTGTLVLCEADGTLLEEFELEGHTLAHALAWLDRVTAGRGGKGALALPTHELPDHAVARNAPFALDPAAATELEDYYRNAATVLAEVRARQAHASPLRLWPHHFDLATLVSLDPETSGAEARSIGLGFSPGDDSYDEPYFYVTPWPYPPVEGLPVLEAGGRWHVEGWVGATFTSLRLATAAGGEQQARQLRDFLGAAVPVVRDLLSH